MAASYNKLWKQLADKKMSKTLNADVGDIVEYVPDAEIWDFFDNKLAIESINLYLEYY